MACKRQRREPGQRLVVITLFPAIDLQDGRAVRLVQGDFAKVTVFNEDPVEQARAFHAGGAQAIHVVDLDGARTGSPTHAPTVAAIAAAFPGLVQLGGGLRSRAAIETAVATGARRIVVGTAVIEDQELLRWAVSRLGDQLVVALDAREGKVATHGWTRISDTDAVEVATGLMRTGVRHLLYTDIARDGMMQGVNVPATVAMAQASRIPVIASGGITDLDDIRGLLAQAHTGICGAITGRAIYEGTLDVAEAQRLCDAAA